VSFDTPRLGATYLGEGRCHFRVWAPFVQSVAVHVVAPDDSVVPLRTVRGGYHEGTVADLAPGARYYYVLDGDKERPDPASRFQPEGVHGPSQVLDAEFLWGDQCWHGLPWNNYIIYELHTGTFTEAGTFDAAIVHLGEVAELGITAVELMPVAQFSGNRNWGYDGAYPFATQNSYGGPEGLKRFVNACHQRGLAAVLDVVYNHLGPEGNYLRDFGPYFTDRYRTPWGSAINFDGPHSDEVRNFFIENAAQWVAEFHFDALRLDAVHGIFDSSAHPFLEELAAAVHDQAEKLNRRTYVVAESDLNDSRLIRARELGGFGLDAQWNDDFHHALHTLLLSEQTGYYEDFGRIHQLAKAHREGFVYSGEYSKYRLRRHGNSAHDIPTDWFVVFAQNHDQVGNRMRGERLSRLVSFEQLKLAAGSVLFSPFVPLLFMGEEYGETAPFPYFVSHSDPEIVEATRQGRRDEFTSFQWPGEPPDPQDEATFYSAKLNHDLRSAGKHLVLYDFYKELIRLRKGIPALARPSKECMEILVYEQQKLLVVRRWHDSQEAAALFHFGEGLDSVTVPLPAGNWKKHLDSAEERWNGPGSAVANTLDSTGEASVSLIARSVVLFVRSEETRDDG
jgi:maltooligosyltrehalose trehalohydrolase